MKALTDRSIQSLKPRDIRCDVRDAAVPGLSIRVNANGTKTWTVKVSRDGNQQRVTLGRYPEIRLSEARLKATERKQSVNRVAYELLERLQIFSPNTLTRSNSLNGHGAMWSKSPVDICFLRLVVRKLIW